MTLRFNRSMWIVDLMRIGRDLISFVFGLS